MQRRRLTLDALFARSVHDHGSAVAVQDLPGRDGPVPGGPAPRAWSYAGLDAFAETVARDLEARGVGRGDAVAIYAERTVHAVAAILAAARIGAVFVPVSLDTPPARLAHVLEDADALLLLADAAGRERLGRPEWEPGDAHRHQGLPAPVVPIAGPPVRSAGRGPDGVEAGSPDRTVHEDDLAYIIYTSGTTGQPKGVMIEQGSLARRFHDFDARYRLSGRSCRVLQLARLGFDVFLGDLVKALGSGGTLVLCPDEAILDPARLHRWLADEAIDYVEVVPAVLRNLVEHLEASGEDLASLGVLNCGADLFTREEYERARRVTRVPRLFNSYGVTECTVESTSFEDGGAGVAGWETLPIGRPLASDHVVVLDEELRPVARGESGQICVGGPCVARGYRKRPDLDAQAFFVRAGADGVRRRYYKTGDRGRIGADGQVEFLGRVDFQIKIDGHRIEPGEVEAVLERLPSIDRAVVCVPRGESLLIAFVRTTEAVRGGASRSFDPAEAAAHAARHLPGYMLPRRIVPVDSFPLTRNGKIDRRALAERSPEEQRERPAESRAQRWPELAAAGSVEELTAWLWGRGIDLVSVVREFVKPSAPVGVVVSGAFVPEPDREPDPDGVDLELLVLMNGGRPMKRRRREVLGNAVRYHAEEPGRSARVSLALDGLEIGLELIGEAEAAEIPDEVRARLAVGWIVHGPDVVERWRRLGGSGGVGGTGTDGE